MLFEDTIAALATAPGTGGIAIIRISGNDTESILRNIFRPAEKNCAYISHMMYYGHAVYKDEILDECFAVLMRAPRTYTREDVAELHLHGGDYTVTRVLSALCALGARPAEAGEFTKRAFLNGRIDLSRAEAVMKLISARSENAARAAVRQLDGATGTFIKEIEEKLLALMSGIEAAIDYPQEIDFFETAEHIKHEATMLAKALDVACDESGAKALESGLTTVLCGAPNAGKSSLMNHLLHHDRAIVTDTPGTTRDIITEPVYIDGILFKLQDTAGIRDAEENIERIGVDRALEAIKSADLILHLIDGSKKEDEEDQRVSRVISDLPHLTLYTKCDLYKNREKWNENVVYISSRSGDGIEELKQRMLSFAGRRGEAPLTQLRHIALAREAAVALRRCTESAASAVTPELCALDLHDALHKLQEITGEDLSEKLLDTIFSKFCVGK